MPAAHAAEDNAALRTQTRSTCCYCGVSCGVLIETEHGADGVARIVGIEGDAQHPAN